MKILVLECDTCDGAELDAALEGAAGRTEVGMRVLSRTTPQAALLAILEVVPLEFLNTIKLHTIGRVQRRRQKAEQPARHQDED